MTSQVYKVGIGLGLSSASLTKIDPQPMCKGVQVTRRTYPADSSVVYEEKLYAELLWSSIGGGEAYYNLLVLFGVESSITSPVTIRLRDNLFHDVLYQGIAVRPDQGKENDWSYFPKNIKLLIKNLEQLVEA